MTPFYAIAILACSMLPETTAKLIAERLRAARDIILVPHRNPDGDALGSAAGLSDWLSNINVAHSAFCATPINSRLSFIPGNASVTSDASVWQRALLDCVVVCDSGDMEYAGIASHITGLSHRPLIINIDHHHTNTRFGDLNLVLPDASSTAEVMYHFFRWNGIIISSRGATALLAGILTDTDRFTNSATTPESLAAAHELVLRGADLRGIASSIFQNKSVACFRLWGAALSRLERHPALDLAYTFITQEDLKTLGADDADAEGIANTLNELRETRASLILRELQNGEWKGSFRSTRDDTDVSVWARALGGGGHKKSAGFTVVGAREQALTRIFSVIH